jgi:hypothetical protein
MIYIKKIINQDLERTPTFNVESIRDFFKINLDNGQYLLKKIILIPSNEEFNVKFQKRETRDEYRVFLNDLFQKINPVEGDILILRKRHQDTFLCEHINSHNRSYDHLNHLFEERNNHQLIVNDIADENNESANQQINLLDEFISWFIKLDGIKHNYFTDSFSENKEKLKAELIIYEGIYENEFKTKVFTTFKSEINSLIDTIRLNLEKKEGEFFEVWGDGLQTRSFLYVEECIEAIIKLMESNFIGPVNIGSVEMVTINELAQMAIDISKRNINFKNIGGQEFIDKYGFKCPTGVRGRNSDNKLYKEKIGWEVSQPLVVGMEKTYKWIKEQVNMK